MRICHISDTHQQHQNLIIPDNIDLLLFTGDFSHQGHLVDVISFFEWLRSLDVPRIIFICGNHDKFEKGLMKHSDAITSMLYEHKRLEFLKLVKELPEHITYLEEEAIEYMGYKFYGTPISPTFGYGWAWNVDRGDDMKTKLGLIPKNTDILLIHGPPYGIFDYVSERNRRYPGEDLNVGCKDLLERLKKLENIKLVAFGHIHEQYGIMNSPISNTKRCLFSNGAVVNNRLNLIIKKPNIINL